MADEPKLPSVIRLVVGHSRSEVPRATHPHTHTLFSMHAHSECALTHSVMVRGFVQGILWLAVCVFVCSTRYFNNENVMKRLNIYAEAVLQIIERNELVFTHPSDSTVVDGLGEECI